MYCCHCEERSDAAISGGGDWRKSGARGLKNALNGPPTAIQAQSGATIQAGEVVGVGIMRVLRAIKKAAPAFHRWFMKYSGTTMIIDNIEERRRWRQYEERSEADSGTSSERDSPSQK